uniref:NADH dehydrogenase subunit 2 n=1 Tax=Polymesoda caroliniana TaxID=98308 RepID=UPI002A830F7F|nr:NADH dehydrogenase subunit 2 [Polymesoda caroliniana]WOV69027.1 NADH dehydrogenase subunit 2 [Polymesoda caroliniana]
MSSRGWCLFVSFFLMVAGIYWSLNSVSVLGVWFGMDVSFIGTVVLLSGRCYDESDSLIKYFIIQVIGTSFVVFYVVLIEAGLGLEWLDMFLFLGVAMKLGLFPFHFWVPRIMSGLGWLSCFNVAVIQKIAPMWLISNAFSDTFATGCLQCSCLFTVLISGVGGIEMLHFRVLMGYSSLVHSGFMAMLAVSDFNWFVVYYLFYFVISLLFMASMAYIGVYSYQDFLKNKKGAFVWFSVYCLSLSGIPPFLGSFLKVFYFCKMMSFFPLICVGVLVASMVTLYFYLNFFTSMVHGLGVAGVVGLGFDSVTVVLVFVSVAVNLVFGFVSFVFVGLL